MSDSAPAAGDDPAARMVNIPEVGVFELRDKHCFGYQDVTGDDLEWCRTIDDHNAVLKYMRHMCERGNTYVIEMGLSASITELQHASFGPEYKFWRPPPGEPANSVKFLYTWKDFLRQLNDKSKKVLFGEQHDHKIVACLFIRFENTYDHKGSHNSLTSGANYYWAAGGQKDNTCGYGFVRDDGAVLVACPSWGKKQINAYWLSKQLLSALAAKGFATLRGGQGGTWGAGTFKKIKEMHTLNLGFRKNVKYCDWKKNHGTPWGEGPPSDDWWPPSEPGGQMTEEKRRAKFEETQQESIRTGMCNPEFFLVTAQAASGLTANPSFPASLEIDTPRPQDVDVVLQSPSSGKNQSFYINAHARLIPLQRLFSQNDDLAFY